MTTIAAAGFNYSLPGTRRDSAAGQRPTAPSGGRFVLLRVARPNAGLHHKGPGKGCRSPTRRSGAALALGELPPEVVFPRLVDLDAHDVADGQPFGAFVDEQVPVDLGRVGPCAAGGDAVLVDIIDNHL